MTYFYVNLCSSLLILTEFSWYHRRQSFLQKLLLLYMVFNVTSSFCLKLVSLTIGEEHISKYNIRSAGSGKYIFWQCTDGGNMYCLVDISNVWDNQNSHNKPRQLWLKRYNKCHFQIGKNPLISSQHVMCHLWNKIIEE